MALEKGILAARIREDLAEHRIKRKERAVRVISVDADDIARNTIFTTLSKVHADADRAEKNRSAAAVALAG